MQSFARLSLIALVGVACVCLFVGALHLLRVLLGAYGYALPDLLFIALLLGGLGGIYGAFAKIILRRATAKSE